jgi:hypothetical protein
MERSTTSPHRKQVSGTATSQPHQEHAEMPKDKANSQGNNLNDPDQSPAEIADHEQRTKETREEHAQTGGEHDIQGHTPKIPGSDKSR